MPAPFSRWTRDLPPLWSISDATRLGVARSIEVALAAARGGLRVIDVREPDWLDARIGEFVGELRWVLDRAALQEVAIVLARRPALARRLGLAGVHLGGVPSGEVGRARALAGEELLLGYSAHSLEDVLDAARGGADYVMYSPIFAPLSKPLAGKTVGLEGLREVTRLSPIPVLALGGIRAEHAADLRRAGASGAAMMGALLDSEDPEEVARRFVEGWRSAGGGEFLDSDLARGPDGRGA